MKKTFLAGLAILLPIAITLFVIFFFIELLTTPFIGIIEEIISSYGKEIAVNHRYFLLFISHIVVLVLLFLFILLLGFLGRRMIFSWFISLTDRLFSKIPIIKTIYLITQDITKNIIDKKKTFFKARVLVPFPHNKTHALGFLSGEPPDEIKKKAQIIEKDLQSVFIPTAPHPISGFLLMYANEEVKHLDLSTEDLFKILLSCGIFEAGEEKKD